MLHRNIQIIIDPVTHEIMIRQYDKSKPTEQKILIPTCQVLEFLSGMLEMMEIIQSDDGE